MKDRYRETIDRLKSNGITTDTQYTRSINKNNPYDSIGIKFIVDIFYDSVIDNMLNDVKTISLPSIGSLNRSKYKQLAVDLINSGVDVKEASAIAKQTKYDDLISKNKKYGRG